MKGYFYQIRGMWREFKAISHSKIVGFYQDADIFPAYNWFKVANGDYSYLYKRFRIKKTPRFFKVIFKNMSFQFDKLDNTALRKGAKLIYLESLYVSAENPAQKAKFSNMYRSFKAQLEKEYKEDLKNGKTKYKPNELIQIIEEANNQLGAIDLHKISIVRFMGYYNRAVEKIKAKNAQHGNN